MGSLADHKNEALFGTGSISDRELAFWAGYTAAAFDRANVLLCGAKGDGVTDDTAAIQAVIDRSLLVYFPEPPVAYKCGQLNLRSFNYLLGATRGQVTTPQPENGICIDSTVVGLSGTPAAIRIAAGSSHLGVGITIENLWIKGHAHESTDWTGSGFPSFGVYGGSQTDGLTLRNVCITQFNINVQLFDSRSCLVDHCLIARATGSNVIIYGQGTDNVVQFSQLVVTNEAGTAHAAQELVNIHVAERNAGSFPRRTTIKDCLIDEPARAALAALPATVKIGISEDTRVEKCIIYVPTAAAAGTGYGIQIKNGAKRAIIEKTRVEPYVANGTHVPTNTILIEAGAVDTALRDVQTVPNTGGDISDLGTLTLWDNVNGIVRARKTTTANRPSAVTQGKGALWYDETLNIPIFSDGAVWKNAAGVAV